MEEDRKIFEIDMHTYLLDLIEIVKNDDEKKGFLESVDYFFMHGDNINDDNYNAINNNIVKLINCKSLNESLKKTLNFSDGTITERELDDMFKNQKDKYTKFVKESIEKSKFIIYFIKVYNSVLDFDSSNITPEAKSNLTDPLYSLNAFDTIINELRSYGKIDSTLQEFVDGFSLYKNEYHKNINNIKYNNNAIINKRIIRSIDNKKNVELLIDKFSRFVNQVGQVELGQEKMINFMFSLLNRLKILCDCKYENNKNDIIYYLFDNSMREIEFVNKKWNYNWDWNWKYGIGVADLFRCSLETDDRPYVKFKYDSGPNLSAKEYYGSMLRNIVMHVNKGSVDYTKLASYSKKLCLDIYKYMGLPKNNDEHLGVKLAENEGKCFVDLNDIKESLKCKTDRVIFSMIKNANINVFKKNFECNENVDYSIEYLDGKREPKNYCCKVDNEEYAPISFSKFLLSNDNSGNAFCIEIFNKVVYKREVLEEYCKQFSEYDIQGIQREVVSTKDGEVVMLGNTCKKIVDIEKLNIEDRESLYKMTYNELDDNVEYKIKLNIEEIIYLFYRMSVEIYEKKDGILERIEDNFELITNDDNVITKIKIFDEEISLEDEILKDIINTEELKKEVCGKFYLLYNEIVNGIKEDTKNKVKFILKFYIPYYSSCDIDDANIYKYYECNSIINIAKMMCLGKPY